MSLLFFLVFSLEAFFEGANPRAKFARDLANTTYSKEQNDDAQDDH